MPVNALQHRTVQKMFELRNRFRREIGIDDKSINIIIN